MKARVRKREEISAIRKKLEFLEGLKRENNKRGGTPFRDLSPVKPILRELYNEIALIETELTDLSDVNNNVNLAERGFKKSKELLAGKDGYTIEDNNIYYTYKDISLFYNGKRVLIGDIMVRFFFTLDRISLFFYNDAEIMSGGLTYQHPHIRGNYACLGEFGATIAALLSRGDIISAVPLIEQFLNVYNEASPFLRLRHWITSYNYLDCGCLEGDCVCEPPSLQS